MFIKQKSTSDIINSDLIVKINLYSNISIDGTINELNFYTVDYNTSKLKLLDRFTYDTIDELNKAYDTLLNAMFEDIGYVEI